MGEYIEREALMATINKANFPEDDWDTVNNASYALELVRWYPAADVVEVVRCKDCVHWFGRDGDPVCLKIYEDGAVSSYAWQTREPEDFCSYGKRKEAFGDGT